MLFEKEDVLHLLGEFPTVISQIFYFAERRSERDSNALRATGRFCRRLSSAAGFGKIVKELRSRNSKRRSCAATRSVAAVATAALDQQHDRESQRSAGRVGWAPAHASVADSCDVGAALRKQSTASRLSLGGFGFRRLSQVHSDLVDMSVGKNQDNLNPNDVRATAQLLAENAESLQRRWNGAAYRASMACTESDTSESVSGVDNPLCSRQIGCGRCSCASVAPISIPLNLARSRWQTARARLRELPDAGNSDMRYRA